MFEALGSAIDTLTIPLDGNALTDAFALHARFTATLVAAVGAFDHEGLWDLDSSTSMTAWLKDRCALAGPDAHRWAVRAKKLHRLPVTASAGLTPAQIDVILAHLSGRHLALFASHEASVVPTLIGLSVEDTATVMAQWRDRADHDDQVPPEPDRELHCSRTLEGRRVLTGHVDGDGGAVIDTALRLATTRDCPGDLPRTPAVKRADALIDICRFFLDHQHHHPGGRHRPHVNVIIDLETLEHRGQGQLLDGTVLPAGDISRLLCDANLHRVLVTNRSTILDYGTTVHTTPAPLFNALTVRDRHCRWPGCDRPASWCDAHHLRHWAHGGPTDIDNLVLLCRSHHHRLHRPGWHAKLTPDGDLHITDPHGHTHTSHPPIRGPSP